MIRDRPGGRTATSAHALRKPSFLSHSAATSAGSRPSTSISALSFSSTSFVSFLRHRLDEVLDLRVLLGVSALQHDERDVVVREELAVVLEHLEVQRQDPPVGGEHLAEVALALRGRVVDRTGLVGLDVACGHAVGLPRGTPYVLSMPLSPSGRLANSDSTQNVRSFTGTLLICESLVMLVLLRAPPG